MNLLIINSAIWWEDRRGNSYYLLKNIYKKKMLIELILRESYSYHLYHHSRKERGNVFSINMAGLR